MSLTRNDILVTARTWIGTPYHHQASRKQIGSDCLGLILGVYRELYGCMPVIIPNYSPDWAEATRTETMLAGARRYLVEVPIADAQSGDVAVFRFRRNTIAKHAAILTPNNKMIHAMENAKVSEVILGGWWQRRVAAAFSFPGVK